MFSKATYISRRKSLKSKIQTGLLLFLGNDESSINFKDNWYPFRQDSTFLYFFGIDIPGLAAIIDIDEDKEIIFGDDRSVEDSVWIGSTPGIHELAAAVGVTLTLPKSEVSTILLKSSKRGVHYLPPFRPENKQKISEWLKIDQTETSVGASVDFIKAVVSLRSFKSSDEIIEINKAIDITVDMHLAVMKMARAGLKEYELAGVVHRKAIESGGQLAYPLILTINGQILHNHFQGNTLKDGNMVLCDAGAETDLHYAGDLTRTFPVGANFSNQQKEIYQIVLDAHLSAIAALKPGVRFIDVHLVACRKLAEGLKSIGLMKGNVEDAVDHGAHALFFQCGLGHMMGLDVHDMEDLGEQYVGYTEELRKSTQFGIKSLRLGKTLEKDFVLTVEPGIYFIPELIDLWHGENRHSDYINYENLMKYRAFGGIRVEDNFVITKDNAQMLGKPLPRTIDDIQDVRNESLNDKLFGVFRLPR
ncbi:MAG: aminopeptidase P family protein [Cyclobacteriaceae bacterium]